MNPPSLLPFIPYSDLWRIFKRARRLIIACALTCGCSALLYTLTKPTWYRSDAVFREKINMSQKSPLQSDGLLSSLVSGGASSPSGQDLHSLMRSKKVLKPAITAAGLQVRLRPLLSPPALLLHLTDNLRVEARYWYDFFDPDTPFTPFYNTSLRAKDVTYEGESTLYYTLIFLTDTQYKITDSSGEVLGLGTLEEPFSHPLFSLKFSADTPDGLSGRHFRIKLVSLQKAVERCQAHLTIRAVKEREKLFQLTFYHQNRTVVSAFLNALMLSYQNHHVEETKRIAQQEHLLWEQEQNSALQDLEKSMHTYAKAGQKLIETTGFLDPEKQLSFLIAAEQRLHARQDELVEQKTRCSRMLALPLDCPMMLLLPAQTMPEEVKSMVKEYLHDDAERKILIEALKNVQSAAPEANLQGLSLESAQKRLSALERTRQENDALITEHRLLLEHLNDPEFPLSALTEMLKDPTSQEILLTARTLQAKLHDAENYHEKDRLHIEHTLAMQRASSKAHFTRRLEALKRQTEETLSHLHALQNYTLTLLTEKLALHEREIKAALSALLASATQEEELLNIEMRTLQEALADVPALWATQQMQQAALVLHKSTLKERSKWMESYQAMHLHDLLLSGPVDFATLPLFPSYPGVLFFTLLGSLLGALPACFYALIRARKQGLIASPRLLELMGQNVLGTLSLPEVGSQENQEHLSYLIFEMQRAQEGSSWLVFCTQEIREMAANLVNRLQAQSDSVNISLSDVSPTSKRALQLLHEAHGAVIFLPEEGDVTLSQLQPLWSVHASAKFKRPLFFVFTKTAVEPEATWVFRLGQLYRHALLQLKAVQEAANRFLENNGL